MSELSSAKPTLPIDVAAVKRQFSRRGGQQAEFLYREISARMQERLDYIRLAPHLIVDAGCAVGQDAVALLQRYPEARYLGVDHAEALIEAARAERRGPRRWWSRFRAGTQEREAFVCADLAQTGLPPESADLVWSNLALHWHPAPHAVIEEWWRVLRTHGLVMFSSLGPASFQEIRSAVQAMGYQTAVPAFVDMHDFGDLLNESGFSDPVMDQETLTLTYQDPKTLLKELSLMGGNPSLGRHPGLRGKGWYNRLLEALEAQRKPDGKLHLSLEIAYGHAWRSGTRKSDANTALISVESIGRRSKNGS